MPDYEYDVKMDYKLWNSDSEEETADPAPSGAEGVGETRRRANIAETDLAREKELHRNGIIKI